MKIQHQVLLLALVAVIWGCTGKTGEELLAEGMQALREGKSGSAIVLLRSALDKEQNNSEVRYQLAHAYVAEGKFELAEREYLKVRHQNPDRAAIALDLAGVYVHLKKPDQAILQAEEYLAGKPDSADAREVIGKAHAMRGELREAESSLLQACRIEPGKQSAILALASLYLRQERAEEARTLLGGIIAKTPLHVKANNLYAEAELALGRKRSARAIYQRLVDGNHDDYQALYRAGLLDLELGETAQAARTADTLVSRFPKHAEGYRLKGFVLFAAKRYPEAIAVLQSANRLQPTIAGYYYLGLSLFGTGDLETALNQFRLILDRQPDFHQARMMTGVILLRQKRIDDAVAEVSRLVEADPGNALAHNLLGSAYMAKGMYVEGLRALDRSIALNPGLIDTYLKKGMIHLSLGKVGAVEADLATAVKTAPDAVHARLILSAFHLYRNNHAKALSTLGEGLSDQATDAALHAGMARILFSEHRNAEAIRQLQKAKEKDTNSIDPYFLLADHYTVTGDADKALAEYGAVLRKQTANLQALLRMAALLDDRTRHDEARALLLKAKESREPAAYVALAHHHERGGRLQEAQAVYAEALGVLPRSTIILEEQGRLYLKNGQYAEALKSFDAIETISPEAGIPLLVAAHRSRNNRAEAIKAAQRAIEAKPAASFGYLLLASLYADQSNFEPAMAELKKAMDRDRRNPQPALALAGLQAKAGNHDQALATCNTVVRTFPQYAPAYAALAGILDARGEKKEAVKQYRAALSLAGSYLPALNNLAQLCADGFCGRDEALRLAERASAIAGDSPEVLDTLGYALLKNGRLDEALTQLRKAEARLAGNPTIQYHLALVHAARGEQKQAVERLQAALRSPEFDEAAQARRLLAKLN